MVASTDAEAARREIARALPSPIASVLTEPELDAIRQRLKALPEYPTRARLQVNDGLRGAAVFFWVFASMVPVILPFLLMDTLSVAIRVSNGIAMLMLFAAGAVYGRAAGRNPWIVGVAMILIGAALVSLTIAFGG